jgi:hypothetical protein
MNWIGIAASAAAALAVAGCATVTRGTKDVLVVESTPPGAQVTTTNGFACATPCSLKMPRRSEFDVDISKPGYRALRVHVTNGVSGQGGLGMAGNVLVGGIIGAGVDAGTGAMMDLVPNPIVVALESSARPSAAGLSVASAGR